MNRSSRKRWGALSVLLVFVGLTLGLVACGGGGGSSQVAVSTGQVALLVTDGPTEMFDEINVLLERVELLGPGGTVVVFSSQPGTLVDLLKLRGETQLLTLSDGVPVGRYDKIRLQVASVELVKRAANGDILERHLADLPAKGKIDLNPRGSFEVTSGGTLLIQLDMDANKAIHIVQTGQSQKYKFRPVVFVDIGTQMIQGKLVRLDGYVRALEADGFLLCRQSSLSPSAIDAWAGRCVAVRVAAKTVFFDEFGDSAPFTELQLDDPVQVVGRFRVSDPVQPDDQVFAGFDAYVVEIGEFLTLRGTILNTPLLQGGEVVFDFEPVPGQGVTGVLQAQTDGTRVFAVDGSELDLMDLAVGAKVLVDGVLAVGAEVDLFKAALILRETALAEISLEGIIAGPTPLASPLQINVQGISRCVRTTADTDYYLLTAGSLTPMTFGQLALGDDVLVFGREDGLGCLVAEDLFVRQ